MPFHTEVMVVLMEFMTVEIAVEIAVHTVVTVVWIVFSTEETAVEIAVQMVLKVVWILVRTVVKKLETAVNTVVATLWIAETVFEKKLLIPLHTVSKKLLILPQTVCQSVPNRPRNTSSALFSAVSVVVNTDFTPSQMLEKMPFTASHAPLQLPENTLEKTSNSPSKVSRTTPRMVEIFWNAPSNSAAST